MGLACFVCAIGGFLRLLVAIGLLGSSGLFVLAMPIWMYLYGSGMVFQ